MGTAAGLWVEHITAQKGQCTLTPVLILTIIISLIDSDNIILPTFNSVCTCTVI